jgi:hypothetical protein
VVGRCVAGKLRLHDERHLGPAGLRRRVTLSQSAQAAPHGGCPAKVESLDNINENKVLGTGVAVRYVNCFNICAMGI